MFVIIWRRSGIAILIYVALSFWIVGYFFEKHSDNNAPYIGWSFFYAAIMTALHALALIGGRNATDETDTGAPIPLNVNMGVPQPAPAPKSSIWHHSLFFIPVVFWPLIFGGISGYKLLSGGEKDKVVMDKVVPPKKEVKEKRTVHFLNSTSDTLICRVDAPDGGYKDERVSPRSYISRLYEEGTYKIIIANTDRDIIFSIPADQHAPDQNKYKTAKNDEGKVVVYRILNAPTPSENDYDEAWVMMDGEHDMMLVDVSEICSRTVTEKEIKKIDWTKNIVAKYDGDNLIEPMYGEDPGTDTYTILDTGTDIPNKLKKNEHVYALMSTKPDAEIDSKYIADKILDRVVINN